MKLEALPQCSGEAIYTNDVPPLNDEVFCAFVHGTVVGAEVEQIDASEALKIPGVIAFYSAKDIPGTNSFVYKPLGFTDDEPVFAQKINHHYQPIGVIVAESNYLANKAAEKVKVMYSRAEKQVKATLKDAIESEDT
uniref:Aldehyde oxidase/xanthine dehydrogenase a/b hammerhead domain-containing protein n=1 Tax=Megaselia scalaris TaxID=36166 RepID=T1GIZ8_MEGSC